MDENSFFTTSLPTQIVPNILDMRAILQHVWDTVGCHTEWMRGAFDQLRRGEVMNMAEQTTRQSPPDRCKEPNQY